VVGFGYTPASRRAIQTRRAAGMDARRFRTEPWMASTKIPKMLPIAGLFFSGGHFFLVTFSLGQQRKSHSAAAADEDPRFTASPSKVHGLLASLVPAGSSCGRPARFALVPLSRG
jgi:hypothetical protein